jgi:hypothetical protein
MIAKCSTFFSFVNPGEIAMGFRLCCHFNQCHYRVLKEVWKENLPQLPEQPKTEFCAFQYTSQRGNNKTRDAAMHDSD